ncbi:MAG: Gfo/Idh/MocA family oxidoreductase [Planctomycetes bacterium]|nr:Gfo/Idh/MocA family oxidoreductase [Planctomycetota bacterium]
MNPLNRRAFLKQSALATLSALPALRLGAAGAAEKATLGVIGFRGRGGALLRGFLDIPEVEVAYLCDVDGGVLARGVEQVEKARGRRPQAVEDFRRILDDKAVDAIVLGTPDHWHAIPAILACQAGKHVYVEKPASHNIREGQLMLQAARKHKRAVQVGCQSRSGRHFAEAMEYLRTGALGKVTFARAWESTKQGPIGYPKDCDPPPGVNYDLWLGPAPLRPFNPARFHGSWRWFFDYGTGDLGNDGVHRIDFARRALAAAFEGQGMRLPDWPQAVSASGGKYVFDDAQEWPDTLLVAWDYPGATLVYEMRVWNNYPMEGEPEGAAVYGTNGYVVIGNRRWRAFGPGGEPLEKGTSSANDEHDAAHKRNFLECIKTGQLPDFDIAEGHISSSMCHMGNTAWRVGRKLRFDPASHAYAGDPEANRFLTRDYRKPWALPEV